MVSTIGLFGPGQGPVIYLGANGYVFVEIKGLQRGKVSVTSPLGVQEFDSNGRHLIGECGWVRVSHEGEEVSNGMLCSVKVE